MPRENVANSTTTHRQLAGIWNSRFVESAIVPRQGHTGAGLSARRLSSPEATGYFMTEVCTYPHTHTVAFLPALALAVLAHRPPIAQFSLTQPKPHLLQSQPACGSPFLCPQYSIPLSSTAFDERLYSKNDYV